MKKCFIGIFVAVLIVSMTGCKGEVSSGNGIPSDFVKITGETISGGNQFTTSNGKTGVFVNGRTVKLSDFYICDHEVTQAEYKAVMGNNPSYFQGESYPPANGETQGNRPVETVNWYAALVYCNKKSLKENLTPCYKINGTDKPDQWGQIPVSNDVTWNTVTCDFSADGYRLPTEAEWEYAARGGKSGCETATLDDWAGTDSSSELGKYAWYSTNSGSKTHEVKKDKVSGTDSANALGLYDMSGNVWEWCWDLYDSDITSNDAAYTTDGVVINPKGASSSLYRVFRGGAWDVNDNNCSVVSRDFNGPNSSWGFLGFRVVRTGE